MIDVDYDEVYSNNYILDLCFSISGHNKQNSLFNSRDLFLGNVNCEVVWCEKAFK